MRPRTSLRSVSSLGSSDLLYFASFRITGIAVPRAHPVQMTARAHVAVVLVFIYRLLLLLLPLRALDSELLLRFRLRLRLRKLPPVRADLHSRLTTCALRIVRPTFAPFRSICGAIRAQFETLLVITWCMALVYNLVYGPGVAQRYKLPPGPPRTNLHELGNGTRPAARLAPFYQTEF